MESSTLVRLLIFNLLIMFCREPEMRSLQCSLLLSRFHIWGFLEPLELTIYIIWLRMRYFSYFPFSYDLDILFSEYTAVGFTLFALLSCPWHWHCFSSMLGSLCHLRGTHIFTQRSLSISLIVILSMIISKWVLGLKLSDSYFNFFNCSLFLNVDGFHANV